MRMRMVVFAVSAELAVCAAAADFDVRRYGAKGDGKAKDTAAVQAAIDACSASGGGRVVLAAGTFVVAPITLRGGVDLHVAEDARLLGSPDLTDYSNRTDLRHVDVNRMARHRNTALVYAEECAHVSISGRGTIDANGAAFMRAKTDPDWTAYPFERTVALSNSVPRVVFFAGVTDVSISDITLTGLPAGWGFWINDCDRVNFSRVKVKADVRFPNNDGIHLNCSRDVTVTDCLLETGDDALVVRANSAMLAENRPCERVTVSNCTIRSWCSAVRIGWVNDGVIRHCSFSHLNVEDCTKGISIEMPEIYEGMTDYGRESTHIEDLAFSDITLSRVYTHPIKCEIAAADGTRVSCVRNVRFSRLRARSLCDPYFSGRADASFEDFAFTDCTFGRLSEADLPIRWDRHGCSAWNRRGDVPPVECRRFVFDETTRRGWPAIVRTRARGLSRREAVVSWFRENWFGDAPGRPGDERFHEDGVSCADGRIRIRVSATLPEGASPENPAPVFVFGDHFNAQTSASHLAHYPNIPTNAITARGYAYVTFNFNDLALNDYAAPEDEPKLLASNRVYQVYGKGKGTLAAWAWGYSRVMDWIETRPELDARRVAIVGHSRGGKTALWAGVRDERIALTIANGSGTGGARALKLPLKGAERIADFRREGVGHWFADPFHSFAGRESLLPYDAPDLLKCLAPRLVYLSGAADDVWAGPEGEFETAWALAADRDRPGSLKLPWEKLPAPGSSFLEGPVGYHNRGGKHKLQPEDWEHFLDFADRHLKGLCPTAETPWTGKRIAVFGDSISDRRIHWWKHWWRWVGEELGAKMSVYAVNGRQWNDVPRQIDDLKADLGDDVDAILIFMGTNDYNSNIPLGEWWRLTQETVNRNGKSVTVTRRQPLFEKGTVRGRINVALNRLKREYPDRQIVLMTPIRRGFFTCGEKNVQPEDSYSNALGLFLTDYARVVREAGEVWSVPVIDTCSESGLLPALDSYSPCCNRTGTDRLHLSTEGSRRLALTVAARLKTLPPTFRPRAEPVDTGSAPADVPRLPGEPCTKPAIGCAPFPNRMSAYVWRNWFVVPHVRLAEAVGAKESELEDVAAEMGLPRKVSVLPEWRRKGYITILRRNWHLLDYPQLLKVVDMTREELRFSLMEDDFLFVKLGNLKPKCGELVWSAEEAAKSRAARLRLASILKEDGVDDFSEEPRFTFVRRLSTPDVRAPVAQSKASDSPFDLRMIFSYFADYGDPLGDPEIGSYPEGLLQKLAAQGVNAVWLHTVLRTLAKDPKYPEFGAGSERRLANLTTLVKRCARYGIKVYLYLNEPRAMPDGFFRGHPEREAFRGCDNANWPVFAMCTSCPEVRRWVRDSVERVFRAVPGLGGIFTITMSENLTNCASRGNKKGCPCCRNRNSSEIVAEINRAMIEGMLAGNPGAEAVLYDWQWQQTDGGADGVMRLLPKRNVRILSVSETGLPVNRGGDGVKVSDYSISVVGPGKMARDVWAAARANGIPTAAKVQTNCSWELAAFPYLPVIDLVAEHACNLVREGVDGVMLSWSLGCCPAPNLSVFRDIRASDPGKGAVLDRIATETYGAAAVPAVRAAWTAYADGYREYPFSCSVAYDGPQHMGPANPLYGQPTHYTATMVGIPYDDLKHWCAEYPPAAWRAQMVKVRDGFERGSALFEKALPLMPAGKRAAAEKELRMFQAATLHFRSCVDQVDFYLARQAKDSAAMCAAAERELKTAKALLPLVRADSRFGYESSNQYFYLPQDLREKVLSCRMVPSASLSD